MKKMEEEIGTFVTREKEEREALLAAPPPPPQLGFGSIAGLGRRRRYCCDDEEHRYCWDDDELRYFWEEEHCSWDEDATVARLAGGGVVDRWWLVGESWKGVGWDVSRFENERERGVGFSPLLLSCFLKEK